MEALSSLVLIEKARRSPAHSPLRQQAAALMREDHAYSMRTKKRQRRSAPLKSRIYWGPQYANLSWRHPDYGMSPAAHAEMKDARRAGKAKFIDKEPLAGRRQGLARSMGL